jgi:polyhydroxyalkanoate synthesis regulator phasin
MLLNDITFMEIIMFKKIFVIGAVLPFFKMGVVYQLSAMEKQEKSSEKKISKSELSEEEKKRLIENRMIMERAMKEELGHDVPNDVRNIISDYEYTLTKKVNFKCPTSEMKLLERHITGNTYIDDMGIIWKGVQVSNEITRVDISRKDNKYITINCWYKKKNEEDFNIPILAIQFDASEIDPSSIRFDKKGLKLETFSGYEIFSSEKNVEITALRK